MTTEFIGVLILYGVWCFMATFAAYQYWQMRADLKKVAKGVLGDALGSSQYDRDIPPQKA